MPPAAVVAEDSGETLLAISVRNTGAGLAVLRGWALRAGSSPGEARHTDLDAFRRVLEDGTAGRLVPVYDSDALAAALIDVLRDDEARENLVAAASKAVQRYDWSVVARQILQVYETVAGAGVKVQVAS